MYTQCTKSKCKLYYSLVYKMLNFIPWILSIGKCLCYITHYTIFFELYVYHTSVLWNIKGDKKN